MRVAPVILSQLAYCGSIGRGERSLPDKDGDKGFSGGVAVKEASVGCVGGGLETWTSGVVGADADESCCERHVGWEVSIVERRGGKIVC